MLALTLQTDVDTTLFHLLEDYLPLIAEEGQSMHALNKNN